MSLSLLQCYWTKCKEPVTVKWQPTPPKPFLWVCDYHFKMISWVHFYEVVEESEYFKSVKVIPEPRVQ